MRDPAGARHHRLFSILTALLLVWSVFGVLDVGQRSTGGFSFDSDNSVTELAEGGPAATAGMLVGDRIVSLEGVSMDDLQGRAGLDRVEIGEARAVEVERGEEGTTLSVVYGTRSAVDLITDYLTLLMGLAFLFAGVWAYFTAPHAGSFRLAILGCCLGPVFLSGPYIGPGTLSDVLSVVAIAAFVMGFAVLFDFVLRSGRADGYAAGGGRPGWVYGPAVLVALLLSSFVVFQPTLDGAPGVIFAVVLGAFFVAYVGGSLLLVVRNHMKADAGMRASRGLGLMLAGAVIGLGPLVLAFVIGLLPGDIALPGAQYWVFTLVAVPISFALAAVRPGGEAAPA